MYSIIKAEFLKLHRTFGAKLIWIAPVITLLLAGLLTAGMKNCYSESAWNWWYTLLLPGMIALVSQLSISKEKKLRYYNQITLVIEKKWLMLGKILFLAIMVLVANLILLAGAISGSFVLSASVPAWGAVAAVFVLTVTYLWEIPFFLYLSARFGMTVDMVVCLFISVAGVLAAPSDKWYFVPFSIPMRVVCPLIHVLPNGLRAPLNSPLLNKNVLFPGIVLSLCWFLFVTILFLRWFDKKEGK